MMAIRRDGQDAYSRRLKAFVAIAGPLARPASGPKGFFRKS